MSLVAFDFDGTLSESEMTVLLAEQHGVTDAVAEITRQAMNDELDYAESLRRRVGLLEGLPATEAQAAFDAVRLRPGAGDLIAALSAAGVETAILTGGFRRGVEAALDAAGVSVDHIISNQIIISDDRVTGTVEGPLIEGTKDDALANLVATTGVTETVAVGDGANDLPMLAAADLSIGFDPHPAVASSCDLLVEDVAALRQTFEEHNLL